MFIKIILSRKFYDPRKKKLFVPTLIRFNIFYVGFKNSTQVLLCMALQPWSSTKLIKFCICVGNICFTVKFNLQTALCCCFALKKKKHLIYATPAAKIKSILIFCKLFSINTYGYSFTNTITKMIDCSVQFDRDHDTLELERVVINNYFAYSICERTSQVFFNLGVHPENAKVRALGQT